MPKHNSSKSARKIRGDGNTKSPLNKQCAPRISWCFTISDDKYTNSSNKHTIQEVLDPICKEYVFQLESPDKKIDISCGDKEPDEDDQEYRPYIHWQGYVRFKKKCRPKNLVPGDWGTHWGGTRNRKASIVYCSNKDKRLDVADGNLFVKGVRIPRPLRKVTYTELYAWQKKIADQFDHDCPHHCRTIWWYWEKDGNFGKSYLAKYWCHQKDALMISGKGHDIKYAVSKYEEAHGEGPNIVIMNVPKSVEYISHTAIENVKDACFFSGKYEGCMVMINTPHIIVFSNQEPRTDRMSLDRWNIVHLATRYQKVAAIFKGPGAPQ